MPTLKEKYDRLLPTFLKALPMEDPHFIAKLSAGKMFPGNTRDQVNAKPTNADKVTEFLRRCIDPSFSDDGNSNDALDQLLVIMEASEFPTAIKLAKEFKSGSVGTTTKLKSSLMEKPKYPQLQQKFMKVADWESICPFLINDDDGQRTKMIRKNGTDVEERRNGMLQAFLQESNPTWKKVIDALRAGRYNNLADEIEAELLG